MTSPVQAPTAEWMDLATWQRDPYDAYRRRRATATRRAWTWSGSFFRGSRDAPVTWDS